jgi:excisionase family DNA binding protein
MTTSDPLKKSTESYLLLTSREAAKRLAISERTLWTLTDRGEIRCIRMGTAKRYPIVELEGFIERKLLALREPSAISFIEATQKKSSDK